MSLIKTQEEIDLMRDGGSRLARILDRLTVHVKPGTKTKELDKLAESFVRDEGGVPSFLNYKPRGSKVAYPATACISVNEEVVHGIPGERELVEGDIVGIDIGLMYKGLYVDMARTIPVGKISPEDKKLLDITKEALSIGISASRAGNHVGDIGRAIESYVSTHGHGIICELGGHGVGHAVHEVPFIPNFMPKDPGLELKPGMVLALEPMLTRGGPDINLLEDGYTFVTKDGSRSAHFEHTIAITDDKPEILTIDPK